MGTRLRRPEQAERNRGQLLDAARDVFLARGYGGASLEAIAEEAGFSKGVVYSQFGSKAELFFGLLERRRDEREAEIDAIVDSATGVDAIWRLLRAGAQDSEREVGWGRLLIEFRAVAARDEELNRRYAAAHEGAVARLAATLERVLEGEGIEPDVPVRSMAELLFAVPTGVTLERAANPDALPGEDVVTLLGRALSLPPEGS